MRGAGAMLMVCQHERGAEDMDASEDLDASNKGKKEAGEEEDDEVNGQSRDSVPSMKRVSQRPAGPSLGARSECFYPPAPDILEGEIHLLSKALLINLERRTSCQKYYDGSQLSGHS